jgi:HPt (histidine-containing phosphotransfer) domain-containing protein
VSQVLLSPDVYDRLQQVMASDPDGFRELYRDYLSDAQETLGALRAACDSRSGDEFRSKAHYLKSSSLVLGIQPVAQCCAEMEEFGRSAEFDRASGKLTEVYALLTLVQAELQQRLGPEVLPVAA